MAKMAFSEVIGLEFRRQIDNIKGTRHEPKKGRSL